MPDPVIGKDDAVDDSALPPELQGKSAADIAAYYQRREAVLLDRINRVPPPEKKEPEEKFDIFNDAEGSVDRLVTKKVSAAVDAVSTAAQPSLINAARITVREKHPDFNEFEAEITKRMKTMSAEAQMNPEFWDLTYKVVKGENTDRLVEKARKEASIVEKPTPPGTPPPKPRELSDDEKSVAAKMGISHDKYRDSASRYEETDGKFPITTDSRNPKQKRKAV